MTVAAPKVSVLVPAFNAERFVDDAIQSMAAQTFSDWEIVAVDDASTDRTHEILAGWAARDARVRVWRNEKNLGMTGNWNACLSDASGELVLKLDADDVLRPRALELLVEATKRPGVTGAAVRSLVCSEDLEPISSIPGDGAMENGGIDPLTDHDLPASRWMAIAAMGHQLWASSAVMTDRNWMTAARGWDERFGCASDTDWILRILRREGTFAHRAYVGLRYRQTPDSVSEEFRRLGWLEWESLAVQLANFEALGSRGQFRLARQRRTYLWRRLAELRRSGAQLPEDARRKLEGVFDELTAPPVRDRVFEGLRRFAAGLPF